MTKVLNGKCTSGALPMCPECRTFENPKVHHSLMPKGYRGSEERNRSVLVLVTTQMAMTIQMLTRPKVRWGNLNGSYFVEKSQRALPCPPKRNKKMKTRRLQWSELSFLGLRGCEVLDFEMLSQSERGRRGVGFLPFIDVNGSHNGLHLNLELWVHLCR